MTGKKRPDRAAPDYKKLQREQQNALTLAREQALRTGDLPHEWLLRIARGEPVIQRKLLIYMHASGPNKGKEKSRSWVEEEIYPTLEQRIDAAKASAPYFAPKLATQIIDVKKNSSVDDVLKAIAEKLPV